MVPKTIANVARYHRGGAARALAVALGLVLTLGITVVEAAPTRDFSNDLKEDILWLNTVTGQVAIWLIDGTAIPSASILTTVTEPWAPLSRGDFNGDGDADILWRRTTGEVAIWLMDGPTVLATGVIATNVSNNWSAQ